MNVHLPKLLLGLLLVAAQAAAQGPVQIRCDNPQLPRLPEFSRATGLANSSQAYNARNRFMIEVDHLCHRGYAAVLWDYDTGLSALTPVEPDMRLAVVEAAH